MENKYIWEEVTYIVIELHVGYKNRIQEDDPEKERTWQWFSEEEDEEEDIFFEKQSKQEEKDNEEKAKTIWVATV